MASCFHCGKKGHIATACMAKKAKGNRNRSHTNVIEGENVDNCSYENVFNFKNKADVKNYNLRV